MPEENVCVLLWLSLLSCPACLASNWYAFYLMRNHGQLSDQASSNSDCVDKCASTSGCSAVSYQQSTGVCLKSSCNNLDLVRNTGWNTYVLNLQLFENVNLPAPQFEWMLTDSCGSNNLAGSPGPNVNLYSVTYSPSLSVYEGKAATFAGTASSYGVSDNNTRLNNPMGTQSLTVMLWANWATASTWSTLIEFGANGSRAILFWLGHGGLYYDVKLGTSGCTGNCNISVPFRITPNNWYHIAYVYDGPAKAVKIYMNSTLLAVYSVGTVTNSYTWNFVTIGFSFFDTSSPFNGRLYCYKIHSSALQDHQISALAQSCYNGKLRTSN